MEVVRTVMGAMGSIKILVDLINESKMRDIKLTDGLESIKWDFQVLMGVRLEGKLPHLKPGMQLKLQELAFDIDDFIQALWVPGPCRSFFLVATAMDSRQQLINRVERFKASIKGLNDELPKNSEPTPSGGTSTPADPSSSAPPPILDAPRDHLVGIEGPTREIMELLSPRVKPHHERLSVICIVGCSGSGKTALARALFQDDAVTKDFDCKAWVVASGHTSADILSKTLEEVDPKSTAFQKDKRYLVFVDDVQRGTSCEDIRNAFRENVMGSRIIVTTSVPSIARDCSSGSYVYAMKSLDKENSRKLFREKFQREARYSTEAANGLREKDVDIIIDKCDGLPMAVISSAKSLHGKGLYPETKDFEQVSQELGNCLAGCEDFSAFLGMRRALIEPYEKLLNGSHKQCLQCLLYVSIFPSGHKINSKSLVRRLIAEGLIPGDGTTVKASEFIVGDVRECLRKLMDQHMIEPVPIRNYCNVAKRCRVHSVMLEFSIKKAVDRNFVSLIRKDDPMYKTPCKVRRLTVQSSTLVQGAKCPEGMDLSVLRSLAIFESTILDFEKCKLVRVLNLHGCRGLTQKDLNKICELLLLKYLSLRNTGIHELPENVKKLKFLETLDTRETGVKKLPVEVIMLPRFAYLFGEFELTNVDTISDNLTKFFSEKKSQLHTLGGICVNGTQGLEIVLLVIQHATKLKKVKVWFKDTPSSTGNRGLLMHKFNFLGISKRRKLSAGPSAEPSSYTPDPASATSTPVANDTPELILCVSRLTETLKNRSMDLGSVSIDFNGVPNTFLDFLKTVGTISSIKLRQGLGSLPKPAELKQVSTLRKLHLFSTGLRSKRLAALQHLHCLQYLKLSEDRNELWEDIFHVKVGGFKSLIWLSFESSKLPPIVIDEGAMTFLASLCLLCPEGHGFAGIPYLTNLNEVILHDSVTDVVVKAWKEEAKRHINRPYVEKQHV